MAAVLASTAFMSADVDEVGSFLSEEGGIMVVGYREDSMAEVFCGPDATYIYAQEKNGHEDGYFEALTLSKALEMVRLLS